MAHPHIHRLDVLASGVQVMTGENHFGSCRVKPCSPAIAAVQAIEAPCLCQGFRGGGGLGTHATPAAGQRPAPQSICRVEGWRLAVHGGAAASPAVALRNGSIPSFRYLHDCHASMHCRVLTGCSYPHDAQASRLGVPSF